MVFVVRKGGFHRKEGGKEEVAGGGGRRKDERCWLEAPSYIPQWLEVREVGVIFELYVFVSRWSVVEGRLVSVRRHNTDGAGGR